MSRVLVIGIDGGTFDLIHPWVASGDLPALARLMAEGAHGLLESTLPPVTAPAWVTFATGQNPGKHSVFDFIRPVGGGRFEMVSAASIRAPTLWEILSQAGRTVGVMNVPVTYPPPPVNGFIIPGLLSPTSDTPFSEATSYPPGFLARYEGRLRPYRLYPRVQYKPGNEDAFVADLLDLVERRGEYALHLLADHPADFMMFHFQATDVAQHALWKFVDPTHPDHDPAAAARFGPAIKQIYARIDHFIGQMLDRLPGDVNVIVMSDHGFGALHYVVNLNLLLLERGLLQLKRGVWTRLRTGLFRAGVTPASIWRLIERAGLQNYVWQISKSTRNKIVDKFISFEDVDWARTTAYSIGHVGQIYFNTPDRAETAARVVAALQELRHPVTSQPLVERVIPGEQAAHGPYTHLGPDLHLIMDGYRAITFPLFATDNHIITRQIRGDSGCHRMHGVFIAWGPDVRRGTTVEGARILDLAPTILRLMGLSAPPEMDGRVLDVGQVTTPPHAADVGRVANLPHPAEGLSAAEAAEVEARLRALGYLG